MRHAGAPRALHPLPRRRSRTSAPTSSSAPAAAGWWSGITIRAAWRRTWASWSMPKRPASGPRSRKCSCEPGPRRHHPRARGRDRAGHAADQALHVRADRGGELPAFSGGSHIIVVMRGAQRVYRNPYSLMSSPNELENYQISVLRVDPSRGGSAFMHEQVRVGSQTGDRASGEPVRAREAGPQAPAARRRHRHHAVPGATARPAVDGMCRTSCTTRPARRSTARTASRSRGAEPARARLYHDSEQRFIDIEGLLSRPAARHACVRLRTGRHDHAGARHRARTRLARQPCALREVRRAADRRGIRRPSAASQVWIVHVLPDQSLLEAIEAAGVDAPYLCRGGVCGFCRTEVARASTASWCTTIIFCRTMRRRPAK